MRQRTAVLCWVVATGLAAVELGACTTMGASGLAAGSSSVPAGPSGRAVQEMYVGPSVMQYFLLPQLLIGPTGQYAELDITVRDSAQVPRYGLFHLSVVAPGAVAFPADTLLLGLTGQLVPLPTARVLFTEPKGKSLLTRIEAYLTPAQTLAYLRSPAKTLLLGSSTGRRRFEPDRKAQAALATLAARVGGQAKQ
ncbi:hypothetical protein [Hymenobacter terrenus]|uniref:hypothetical protein n=1 Tax=Hymenobacter terrenus TaxID=1629124 RepID=UPI00061972C2|nr:hypothetical protein [Hymenobacter terrenus]